MIETDDKGSEGPAAAGAQRSGGQQAGRGKGLSAEEEQLWSGA